MSGCIVPVLKSACVVVQCFPVDAPALLEGILQV